MMNLCNIDGVISQESEGRIPVSDRGFLFGDSVYEVIRVHDGVPLFWDEHWGRLGASAAGLMMALDVSEDVVARRVQETVNAADHGDSYVRIVVTRGVGDAPNIDLACANSRQTWVIMVRPLMLASGKSVHLRIVDRLRNDRRALDPAIKSGNYLNNVLGLAEARSSGATDCVMLNTDGAVTEASTANLFVLRRGVWGTPPLDAGILAGITRHALLDFLTAADQRVNEQALTREDLLAADEIFLCSTLRDISPVSHLDGLPMGAAAQTARLIPMFTEHLRRRRTERDLPKWRALLDVSR